MKQKKQFETTFIFEPVAQNTVIRPMAQAVCIARGGEEVQYTDTADKKVKYVNLSDLRYLTLHTKVDGHKISEDGYQLALVAQRTPLRIRVDVNDVHVFISKSTTVTQAMRSFRRKITAYNNKMMRQYERAHQRD